MLRDIATLIWKELTEWVVRGGSRGKLGLVIFLVIFGGFIPLQAGREWIQTPISLMSWMWLPFLLSSGVMCDAIAGERERNTLETLLVSRLSDRAIVLGKVVAAVIYGCGQIWIISLVSALLINVVFWNGSFVFYPPLMLVGLIVLPLLLATFAALVAVLVSLKAQSARQAQQVMSIGLLVLFLPLLAMNFLPESARETVGRMLSQMNGFQVASIAAAFMVTLDLVLLLLALAKFRRRELVI
jgi:ABC-2 type transport system permease protein